MKESPPEFLTAADHQVISSSVQKYVDALCYMFEGGGCTG